MHFQTFEIKKKKINFKKKLKGKESVPYRARGVCVSLCPWELCCQKSEISLWQGLPRQVGLKGRQTKKEPRGPCDSADTYRDTIPLPVWKHQCPLLEPESWGELTGCSDCHTPLEALGGRGLTRGGNSSSGRLQRSRGRWWGILEGDHWEERPAWSEPEWCFAMFEHKVDHKCSWYYIVFLFVLIDRLKTSTSKEQRCEAVHYCLFNWGTRHLKWTGNLTLHREISILYYLSMLNNMPFSLAAKVMLPQREITQHSSKRWVGFNFFTNVIYVKITLIGLPYFLSGNNALQCVFMPCNVFFVIFVCWLKMITIFLFNNLTFFCKCIVMLIKQYRNKRLIKKINNQ